MRSFTKSLVTLLLLFVAGSISAQSLKVILERDYSTTDSYPYYWMGDREGDDPKQPFFCNGTAVVEITDGALRIANNEVQANNYDLQPFVLDWFNTTEGEDYVIRVWLKAEMDGSANLAIGTWGTSGNTTLEFKQSDDYVMYSVNHTAAVTSTENNEHILWQMGSTVGAVYIQKIQILQMGEDKPTLSTWGTWKSLINNSDMEGDDTSSYFSKIWDDETRGDTPTQPSDIVDGAGVDDSRGIVVNTKDKVENPWDNQFWFRFNEPVAAGTKYRVKFDYKADVSGTVPTQAHASKPGDYIHYDLFGDLSFTNDWQHYEKEGTVSSQQSTAEKKFQSVAFNLNGTDSEVLNANTFYFDNIYFDLYEPQIDVQYGENGSIKILFPYYVNTCRLMVQHAGGKRRLILPNEMFTVTINGKTAEFESVEIDATGALLIFISEDWAADNNCEYLSDEDEVVVTLNNTEDEYKLFNIDTNETIASFTQTGRFEETLDELPFTYGAPEMMSSDPEEGSFNLPSTISEFKLTFDKKVIVNKIVAKLDDESLKAEAEEEFSTAITLKRTSDKALADGEHKITVTQIFAEQNLGSNDYSSCEVNFSTGTKVSQDLLDAIAAAKTVLDNTNDARYAGTAYTNLDAAITKYTTEAPSYTAPSVIDAAMIDLGNLSKALTAHKTLVDNYDASNQKAQDLVAELAESKYNKTDLFLQLKEVAEKYAGKQLTDDEELQAGYDELKPITDLCGDFFSEGPSTCGKAGMAVVTDRIREGVEALMALGWTEDDPLIVEANNAMSDDDIIANKIKEALTLKIYEELKSDNPTILQVTDIDENQREIRDSINMTVFIKNPNIYALQAHKGYSEENVPGWKVPTNNGELNTIWRHDLRNIEGLAEDVAFTKYHQETRMEQTITGLPVGIYTVDLNAVNWDNKEDENAFCYVKTSETLPVGEGETEDRDLNFAATIDLQHWGTNVGNHDNLLQDIVVTDGVLTIGVNFGKGAQYEFDYAKLYLYAPVKDYNYNDVFNRVVTSIDENSKTAKVRALQLYDLNGRRIVTAQKGIQIVKKMMSDGTVKTQKVIK